MGQRGSFFDQTPVSQNLPDANIDADEQKLIMIIPGFRQSVLFFVQSLQYNRLCQERERKIGDKILTFSYHYVIVTVRTKLNSG